jgi:hypothetical protein
MSIPITSKADTQVSPEERKKRLCVEMALLQKTKWRWNEIADFYQIASAKANEIRKAALEKGGKVDYDPHAVTVRSVMSLDQTTPETEIGKRSIELDRLLHGTNPIKESNQ